MSERAAIEDLFARVCDTLLGEHSADELGRMLHAPGIKTAGSCYAFATGAGLVVKLPEARVTQLIASGAGCPLGTGRGRPMREWVIVVPGDERTCRAYMLEARDFVAAQKETSGARRKRSSAARSTQRGTE